MTLWTTGQNENNSLANSVLRDKSRTSRRRDIWAHPLGRRVITTTTTMYKQNTIIIIYLELNNILQ